MIRKFLLGLSVFALAVASAASHNLTLFQESVVNGTELKPGQYKLELKDSKVVIKRGKDAVEATVKVETTDAKFASTSVRYRNGDGKYRVQEIRLGGTKTKLVFDN